MIWIFCNSGFGFGITFNSFQAVIYFDVIFIANIFDQPGSTVR